MRFVADECFDARLIDALREDGHDVFAVRKFARGIDDEAVLDLARQEERVILTEDTDFGELVYRLRRPTEGVILLRLGLMAISEKLYRLRKAIAVEGHFAGRFVVVEPHRVRTRSLPSRLA